MKGIAVIVFGVLMLLVNKGVIDAATWSMVWPVLVIVLGVVMLGRKGWHHGMCGGSCGKGGMCGCGASGCGACGKASDHTCEGENCSMCK